MRTLLITVSSILTIVSVVPYIIEIIKGGTKPRIVSWFTWTMLTGIASFASFSDGQIAAGTLAACATFATAVVMVLGWKYGDRHFERVDVVCQLGALSGVALWLLLDSPALAVLVMVSIDLVGCIPTIRHSWQKPHEETWITYGICSVGALLTLLAASEWRVTSVAYPIYLVVANAVIAAFILSSPNRRAKHAPAELREL